MDTAELANFLAWCTVINYCVLLIWTSLFVLAYDRLFWIHNYWFTVSNKQFDIVNYAGIGLLKLFILVFNVAPYLALRIME